MIDHLLHETARNAEIVLPAGTFAEADGTLVNNEGRAQRFFQLFVPDGRYSGELALAARSASPLVGQRPTAGSGSTT